MFIGLELNGLTILSEVYGQLVWHFNLPKIARALHISEPL